MAGKQCFMRISHQYYFVKSITDEPEQNLFFITQIWEGRKSCYGFPE